MMSNLHKVQIHCAIKHDLLELTLDHPKACYQDCWEVKVQESDTVVLFIKDIAYGNVLLPVTVESSLDDSDFILWERDGDGVQSPVFKPTKKLFLHVSAATGATRSKKSTPIVVIRTGRPDVDPA